jgi:hypothetical protein
VQHLAAIYCITASTKAPHEHGLAVILCKWNSSGLDGAASMAMGATASDSKYNPSTTEDGTYIISVIVFDGITSGILFSCFERDGSSQNVL